MWKAPAQLSPSATPVVLVPQATNFNTGQVSVTTDTPVLAANPKRVAVTFQDVEAAGGDNVFIHVPGGSAATGFKLFSGTDPVRVVTQAAVNASTGGGGAHTLAYIEEVTP